MNLLIKLLIKLPFNIGDFLINRFYSKKIGTSKVLRIYYEQKYNVHVGLYSYGGCFDKSFNIGGYVTIGRYCSIAKDVHYFGANHPLYNISTSAYFYNKSLSGYNVKDISRHKLIIEDDVWIGHGSLITCGCNKIGTGSVIGAGSIVTHDIPDYAVVAGNPARIIKYRFPPEYSQKLKNTCWWNEDLSYLINYYNYIDNIDSFCDKFVGEKR